MGGLFSWAVGEDDRNSSHHVIQIDQGGLTLPTREHYINKTTHGKVLTAYLDYMTRVGVLLGGENAETEKQMKDVIQFETELAQITSKFKKQLFKKKKYNHLYNHHVTKHTISVNFN